MTTWYVPLIEEITPDNSTTVCDDPFCYYYCGDTCGATEQERREMAEECDLNW